MQQKSNKDSKNQSDNSARTKKIAGTISAFLLVLVIITLAFWTELTSPGMAPGVDVGSHAFTTKYVVDYVVKHHSLPAINPYWYNGFEIFHNAPPLTYLPFSIIYLITRDILLASRLYCWLILSLISLSTFVVIRRKYDNLKAIIGALIFSLAPIIFLSVNESYTRSLALVFYPLSLYYVDSFLKYPDKRVKNGIILSFLIALTFISHPMVGAVLVIFLSLYILVRLSLDSKLKKFSFFYWLFSVIIGFGLISWYLLPFFIESIGWTALPEQTYKVYSISLYKQLIFISVSLFVFSIIAIAFNRSKQRLALFIVALIGMLFTLGATVPILPQLPLINNIYPRLMITITVLFFTYIVVGSIDFKAIASRIWPKSKESKVAHILVTTTLILIVIGLPFLESVKFNNIFRIYNKPISKKDLELTNRLKAYTSDGRVMLMKYPFGRLLWPVTVNAEKQMVEGAYYSATRQGKHIAWTYDAIDNGWNNYAFEKFKLWNVRFFIRTWAMGSHYADFVDQLSKRGFSPIAGNYDNGFYYNKKASQYIVPLKKKVLIIGKYAPIASALIDSSIQAGSIYVDDYDLKTLKLFDELVLYGFGFRNKQDAQKLVKEYVKSGGKVIVDLMGYKSPLEKNPSFLGVTSYPNVSKKEISLNTTSDGEIKNEIIPNNFKIPSIYSDVEKTKFKEWRFVTYFGLDKALATTDRDFATAVIGYKKVYGKKVWFLGPNFFYHTFASHNPKQIQFLNKLISTNKANRQSDYEIYDESIKAEKSTFSYKSSSNLPLIMSFAYSPHWKAYLNGKPIEVVNLEDLIFLNLPAGSNKVEIKYENTPVHFYGKTLSVLTLLFIGFLLYNEKNNNILYGQIRKRRKKAAK